MVKHLSMDGFELLELEVGIVRHMDDDSICLMLLGFVYIEERIFGEKMD